MRALKRTRAVLRSKEKRIMSVLSAVEHVSGRKRVRGTKCWQVPTVTRKSRSKAGRAGALGPLPFSREGFQRVHDAWPPSQRRSSQFWGMNEHGSHDTITCDSRVAIKTFTRAFIVIFCPGRRRSSIALDITPSPLPTRLCCNVIRYIFLSVFKYFTMIYSYQ